MPGRGLLKAWLAENEFLRGGPGGVPKGLRVLGLGSRVLKVLPASRKWHTANHAVLETSPANGSMLKWVHAVIMLIGWSLEEEPRERLQQGRLPGVF